MKLIVGLGNPGFKYKLTRHNAGFFFVDYLASELKLEFSEKKFKGVYCKGNYLDEIFIIAKPQNYMNNSGEFISQLAHYYKINSADILVIYDDKDLPVGKFKLSLGGSSGGHNGVENIINLLPSNNFLRLRLGIGFNRQFLIKDYVLQNIPADEYYEFGSNFSYYKKIILDFISGKDFRFLTNKYYD